MNDPAYKRKYYLKNRARILEKKAAFRAANKEKLRVEQKAYRKSHPDRIKRTLLKRFYGISLDAFNSMMAQQEGKCAICHNPFGKGRAGPHVDHDHGTGLVRGLLCRGCNLVLGYMEPRPEFAGAATEYLELHKRKLKLA